MPPWSDKRSLRAKHAKNAAQTKAPVSPGLAQPFTETVAEPIKGRGEKGPLVVAQGRAMLTQP